ncbi:Flowering time control protein [Nymphaea thermarum]|nr:Flowering time control protein [Nymphaea thermarum]
MWRILRLFTADRQLSSFSLGAGSQQDSFERNFADCLAPFPPSDSRFYGSDVDTLHFDKSKGEKGAEPSEVLWVGFPVQLNVDEMSLRRAFSPFGEIEKITTFPGRSYAFVKFRSIVSACRAKDALQGKLFNSPRVNICFSKSEIGPVDRARSSDDPLMTSIRTAGNAGYNSRIFHQDKSLDQKGDFDMTPPHFLSNFERKSRDFSVNCVDNVTSQGSPGFAYNIVGKHEKMNFQVHETESGLLDKMQEFPKGHVIDKSLSFHGISPGRAHHDSPHFEHSWDLPDEDTLFREKKKLKLGYFPDKDLPEYSVSNSLQGKYGPQKPFRVATEVKYDNDTEVPFSLRQTPGLQKSDLWSSNDNAEASSVPLLKKFAKLDRFSHGPNRSSLDEEWKWEGTIAKGGTPVCRARCFPVGKVPDITLPEFLDCTARTGLDMLAKHFSQASGVGIVFFVPQSDADIIFYNEFMHYLEEKQRAAVAKLGEKTTLFLVPPSDFSEKVLKVPGKMSISGVILSFQHANTSLQHPSESMSSQHLPPNHHVDDVIYHDDKSITEVPSPNSKLPIWKDRFSRDASIEPISSARYPLPSWHKVDGLEKLPYAGRLMGSVASSSPIGDRASKMLSETGDERNQAYNRNETVSPLQGWKASSGIGDHAPLNPSYGPHSSEVSRAEEYLLVKKKLAEGSSGQYIPENLTPLSKSAVPQLQTKSQMSSSTSVPQLPPEQLAQLASLLMQKQSSTLLPTSSTNISSKLASLSHEPVQNSSFQGNTSAPEPLASSYRRVHQLQEHTSKSQPVPLINDLGVNAQNPEATEKILQHGKEGDSDPQKRLQATLQLAAALLQQIQQQAKSTDRP